jgi:hypothetical protein
MLGVRRQRGFRNRIGNPQNAADVCTRVTARTRVATPRKASMALLLPAALQPCSGRKGQFNVHLDAGFRLRPAAVAEARKPERARIDDRRVAGYEVSDESTGARSNAEAMA